MPVQNDVIHGNSYGRCGYNVWSTASPSPVSGVHRSSGIGKTIEPFTIVLGGQIRTMAAAVNLQSAMAAAVNLQRDAGFMMSNLQILAQFVMSLHRMSSEMLSIGVDHVVFPVEEVDKLSVMPRAQRAAKYMTAMGLWRPPSGPGAPGPLPTSTCMNCKNCKYCFGRKEPSAE